MLLKGVCEAAGTFSRLTEPPGAMNISYATHHIGALREEHLVAHFNRLIQGAVKRVAHLSLFAAEPVDNANSDGSADWYLKVFLSPRESCRQDYHRQQNCANESAVFAIHNQSSSVTKNRITASSALYFGMRVYPSGCTGILQAWRTTDDLP